MAMKDYEAAHQSYEDVLEQLVAELPPEKLLARLSPEQRLDGLSSDEILRAVPPEVREQLAKKLAH